VIVRREHRHYGRRPGRLSADPFGGAADGYAVRVVEVVGSETRSPHRHPHSQEVVYVVSGAGMLWEDGALRRFEQGDIALIEAGVPHATIAQPGKSMHLVCFFPHPNLDSNIEELSNITIAGGAPVPPGSVENRPATPVNHEEDRRE
jgi:quercetin dioxygenase-like cupin family protein